MNPCCKFLSATAIISGIFFCLNACGKEKLSACSGNCSDLTIAGILYDKTTGLALKDQPVNVTLRKKGCPICNDINVVSGKSGNDGRFSFPLEFDTTLLRDNFLIISSALAANYLLHADAVQSPGDANSVQAVSIQFYNLDSTSVSNDSASINNIQFGVYPKALLHMNFHRSAVSTSYPDLDLNINFDDQNLDWGLYITNTNMDTTLIIKTSANIFTKITSVKYISSSSIISHTDSIKCITNGNNNIDIYY